MSKIEQAMEQLRQGRFVLIYDDEDREGETDLIIAAQHITPGAVKRMRRDGGGLIVLMVEHDVAEVFQLPFLTDLYDKASVFYHILREVAANDIPYDAKSSFSLSINHRRTFTGITDVDRSLTMRRFAEIAGSLRKLEDPVKEFGREFRSPGHVPVCRAVKGSLAERSGHTELSTALLKMTGLTPVAGGCEMMGDDGKALKKEDAMRYAEKNGFVFLTGDEIVEAWNAWSE
ncbi:MAG TPA: 3,4-dihydroxy-2-butanone-4-phosphate synthase [Thermoplasmatales archaeon]|nr:3,4-dihydroxy-2-butanone-4-phosphate synthase [Thermoplasmatales archaeon]